MQSMNQPLPTNQDSIILDLIINNIPCHIYWQDCDGEIIGCNKNQAESLGFTSPEEVIGRHPDELLPKHEADEIMRSLVSIVETGKTRTIKEKITFKKGLIEYPLLNVG